MTEVRCPICNGELSYCGTETADGPTRDCLVCQLRDRLAAALDEIRESRLALRMRTEGADKLATMLANAEAAAQWCWLYVEDCDKVEGLERWPWLAMNEVKHE